MKFHMSRYSLMHNRLFTNLHATRKSFSLTKEGDLALEMLDVTGVSWGTAHIVVACNTGIHSSRSSATLRRLQHALVLYVLQPLMPF